MCNFIKEGFIAGSLRGMDGSGVFQLDRAFKSFIHRKAIAGPDFVNNKMADRFVKDTDVSSVTVCHVRHATQGKVGEDNTHPFTAQGEDDNWVVGVHNGTLENWRYQHDAKDFDVDSEWAFNRLANLGVDALKGIKGAYCFIWHDSKTKDKLYMVRNTARPMHFRLTEDKKQMYFASEAGMLAWLTERNNIKTQKEILIMEPGQVYEFDLRAKEVTWTKTAVPAAPVANHTPTQSASSSTSKVEITTNSHEWFFKRVKEAAREARDEIIADIAKAGKKNKVLDDQAELLAAVNSKEEAVLGEQKQLPLSQALAALETPSDLAVLPSKSATERVIEEAEKAIVRAGEDGIDNEWLADESWFSDKTASFNEILEAEEQKVYGEVNWFSGTSYDPDTSTVYGEVRDFVSGKGHVTYDAIIRNVPARIAHAKYINNVHPVVKKAGDYAVIIGIHDDRLVGRIIVMAEMKDEGYNAFMRKMN